MLGNSQNVSPRGLYITCDKQPFIESFIILNKLFHLLAKQQILSPPFLTWKTLTLEEAVRFCCKKHGEEREGQSNGTTPYEPKNSALQGVPGPSLQGVGRKG